MNQISDKRAAGRCLFCSVARAWVAIPTRRSWDIRNPKKKLKKTRIIIITTPPVVSVINEQKCHLQFTLGVIVVALHDIKKKKKKDFLFPVAATFWNYVKWHAFSALSVLSSCMHACELWVSNMCLLMLWMCTLNLKQTPIDHFFVFLAVYYQLCLPP